MNRLFTWPYFKASQVLYEDPSLLAINKPSGVPSQAAHEEGIFQHEDIVSRLRSFVAKREHCEKANVYLGVHQRLDRDTSGALLYTKTRAANPALAKQFENHTVEKRYIAAVSRWPSQQKDMTLRHRLLPLQNNRVEVAHANDPRGLLAVTHVHVLERHEHRALLELVLETGRTHQARVQLAAMGSPIAGDRLYANRDEQYAASRLLLHANILRLIHPLTDEPISIHADVPQVFHRWLANGNKPCIQANGHVDREALREAIECACERRFSLAHAGLLSTHDSNYTTAFRLINEEGDGCFGFAVDVYNDFALVHFYSGEALAAREVIFDALEAIGLSNIYFKIRPKQANTLVDSHSEQFAPTQPARGHNADKEISIFEYGLPYLVRLADGLSTGIFFDQRENRSRIRALSKGKRILNLFAYTCGFTVAAAAGGASHTVSVDASKNVLERGRRMLEHAHLNGKQHEFFDEDVFEYLTRASRKHQAFDVVILDPPSYSTVGSRRFSTASGDYRTLASLAMSVVARDGLLLACSNHRQTVQAKLRRLLHEAARAAGRTIIQMKDGAPPVDFPAPWGHESHLKTLWVRLS